MHWATEPGVSRAGAFWRGNFLVSKLQLKHLFSLKICSSRLWVSVFLSTRSSQTHALRGSARGVLWSPSAPLLPFHQPCAHRTRVSSCSSNHLLVLALLSGVRGTRSGNGPGWAEHGEEHAARPTAHPQKAVHRSTVTTDWWPSLPLILTCAVSGFPLPGCY